MVFFHRSILVDQHIEMPKSVNSTDPSLKLQQINHFHKNKRISNTTNQLNIPASMAVVGIMVCTYRRCGKHGCSGLHNASEFDIQIETEDCLKKPNMLEKAALNRGLFKLHRDHHRELEAELKKMAPPNGRAVLVF